MVVEPVLRDPEEQALGEEENTKRNVGLYLSVLPSVPVPVDVLHESLVNNNVATSMRLVTSKVHSTHSPDRAEGPSFQ